MLAYLEVEYEDKQYPAFKMAGIKEWNNVKTKLDLDFPNLPYWKEAGVSFTESRAIIKHVARTRGNGILMPPSSDENLVTMAENLEGVLYDLEYLLVKRCIHDAVSTKDMAKDKQFRQFVLFLGPIHIRSENTGTHKICRA